VAPPHSAVFEPRGDVPATETDNTKARRFLGWEPRTMLQERLEQLVNWYQRDRSWAMNVETTQLG
jgi:nucleoside-diphosphate-sugar epimerase